MSKRDIAQPGGSLRGEGMDESNPIRFDGAFFKTNGIKAQFGNTERLEGKLLFSKLDEPIVSLHSSQRAFFWIQTPTTLYISTNLADSP